MMDEAIQFNFGDSLKNLKEGRKVTRNGWDRKYMCIALNPGHLSVAVRNQATAHNTPVGSEIKPLPYLEMKTAGGQTVPWIPSHADILAEDWVVVP